MLVDEIELHMHPAWQQRVLADLQRAFPETQFIVTTHSAPILTTVPDECIRILEEGRVHAAPPGTEGAEVSRVLKRILGVDVRPPKIRLPGNPKSTLLWSMPTSGNLHVLWSCANSWIHAIKVRNRRCWKLTCVSRTGNGSWLSEARAERNYTTQTQRLRSCCAPKFLEANAQRSTLSGATGL